MQSSPCLAVERVSKRYGHVQAIDNISLTLHAGEIVALVGDNGAGKSTLMNIMCGARTPDGGRVVAGTTPLRSLADAQELGVGMVYQDLALAPDLSVAENVFLGREIRRNGLRGAFGWLDRDAMRIQAAQAIAELGGTIRSVEAPVDALSGGQRQVTAVARTIMISKLAVLLDEPTAALGPKQVRVVIDAIRRAAARGLGVMVISHDVPHMLEVADRMLVLRHGRVVLDAPVEQLRIASVVTAMVGDDAERGERP